MQLADVTQVTAKEFLAAPRQQLGEDAIDVDHPHQYNAAHALLQVSAS